MGWIVGTLIFWGLKLIVTPFAKLLAGDKVKVVTPAAPPPSGDAALQDETGAPLAPCAGGTASDHPTGYYILADVLVLGLAGLLLGLFTGSYFIGSTGAPKTGRA